MRHRLTAQTSDKACAIFDQVARLPRGRREREVDRLCAGDEHVKRAVVRMLDSYDTSTLEDYLAEPHRRFSGRGVGGSHDPVTPRAIGSYRVTGRLGIGGSGVVYRGESPPPTKREVAIKVLRSGVPPSAVERFRVEQKALAALNHPGIAQIYDSGVSARDEPYAVYELVDGEIITVFARQHGLNWRLRIELIIQVCEAVQYAHQHGVIHRDLKPGNLLVSAADGRPVVKIIDFGVSKLVDHDLITTQTEHGQLVGTFAYMAPEFLAGTHTIDARVDVYALGILLYELLEEVHPFEAHLWSLPDLVRAVNLPRRPRVASAEVGCRDDLTAVVRMATLPEPDERYATPKHLVDDLRRVLSGRPVEARAPSLLYVVGKFARRRPIAVGIGVLIIAVVVTLLMTTVDAGRRAAYQRTALQETMAYLADDVLDELSEKSGTSESRLRLARVVDQRLSDLRLNGAASVDMRRKHALVLEVLGDALVQHGEWDEAREARDRLLTELESLHAETEPDRELRRQLARAIVKVGDVAKRDRFEAGMPWYERADRMIVDLMCDFPDDLSLQDDYCWSLERRSCLIRKAGRIAEAEAMMKERLERAERLLAARPSSPVAMHNVAAGHCQLYGLYASDIRDDALALSHAEAAVPIADRMAALEPSRFAYELLAISAHRSLIKALVRTGDVERARALHGPLVARAERLEKLNPQNPHAKRFTEYVRRMKVGAGKD